MFKRDKWNTVKFIIGGALFAGMLYIHVYKKDLDTLLFLIPGFLMGIDPSKFTRK